VKHTATYLRTVISHKCRVCKNNRYTLIRECPEQHTCPLWPFRLNGVVCRPDPVPVTSQPPQPIGSLLGYCLSGDAWALHITTRATYEFVAKTSSDTLTTIIDWPCSNYRDEMEFNVEIRGVLSDYVPCVRSVELYEFSVQSLEDAESAAKLQTRDLNDYID